MAIAVISYSRPDRPLVNRLVELLRAFVREAERTVYWDGDLEPGVAWFEQITNAIDEAPALFVIWCSHGATSTQVRREFTYALEARKKVVPVLIDDTPLCPELAGIHGIDMRQIFLHDIRTTQSTDDFIRGESPAAPRPYLGLRAVFYLLLFLLPLVIGAMFAPVSPAIAALLTTAGYAVIVSAILVAARFRQKLRRPKAKLDVSPYLDAAEQAGDWQTLRTIADEFAVYLRHSGEPIQREL